MPHPRICLFLFAAGTLLAGCNSRNQPPETGTRAPRPDTTAATAAAAQAPAAPLLPYRVLAARRDSSRGPEPVRIGNTTYRLELTARADTARPLRYRRPTAASPAAADTAAGLYEGYQGTYTFRLLRPNGQPQFVRQLTKSDFRQAMGPDLAVEAVVQRPVFLGYLPAFGALAFEISFCPPESDAGGEALLLLDATTGQVRHKSLSRWTGGCNSAPALAANGRLLLTSAEILQANGPTASLNRPDGQVAGTLLVNDQTVLVVYWPNHDAQGETIPLKGPNTRLLAADGRVLKAFSLESTDGGLGSNLLGNYLPATRTHYLFDESNRRLALVPADHPTRLQVRPLRQLPRFRPPQHPTETTVEFFPESGTHATFYVDKTTGGVRYELQKPTN